jgi:hypothetical protein
MKIHLPSRRALALLLVVLTLAGCSKEKALALKTAAEAARTQAIAALTGARELIGRSIAMPAETQEQRISKLAADFADATNLNSEALNLVMTEAEVGDGARRILDTEFGQLERKYAAFAAMFRSLPEGSYLSAEAVKKAEAHAIQLAAEFMKFAQNVGQLPGVFTGERTALIEAVNRAKKLAPPARDEMLRSHAAAALQLRQNERAAKAAAIVACLRAAEAFRTTAELIRGYGKLSAGDMLTSVREVLSLANDISGQQADVAGLLARYGEVETGIRADPYWRPLLNLELKP